MIPSAAASSATSDRASASPKSTSASPASLPLRCEPCRHVVDPARLARRGSIPPRSGEHLGSTGVPAESWSSRTAFKVCEPCTSVARIRPDAHPPRDSARGFRTLDFCAARALSRARATSSTSIVRDGARECRAPMPRLCALRGPPSARESGSEKGATNPRFPFDAARKCTSDRERPGPATLRTTAGRQRRGQQATMFFESGSSSG